MSDGERFEDWFDYCRGHITYQTLIAGKRRPKKPATMKQTYGLLVVYVGCLMSQLVNTECKLLNIRSIIQVYIKL